MTNAKLDEPYEFRGKKHAEAAAEGMFYDYSLFKIPAITMRQHKQIQWWRKVGFYTGEELPTELTT